MLFNSINFFIFLPIVFLIYWKIFVNNYKLQNFFLLLSSYLFYSFWSVKFLYLLVIITVLDYLYAFAVDSKNIKIRRLFLVLSILNNFGVLFYFKYTN